MACLQEVGLMQLGIIEKRLSQAASALATGLAERNRRIVFAESCTAGLVSATLAGVPGISAYHCGSAVTYRNDTKARWLGVSEQTLQTVGAVSRETAMEMAAGVLKNTPEADVGISVTGHLGPNAPAELDGVIWIGTACTEEAIAVQKNLAELESTNSERAYRQRFAATLVLELALNAVREC
ncbi:MAG: CinA family protein [Planctomycetaceae bacterium]